MIALLTEDSLILYDPCVIENDRFRRATYDDMGTKELHLSIGTFKAGCMAICVNANTIFKI